jgi:ferritin-like metal-binding protein YciE
MKSKLSSLTELLLDQLRSLYDAEKHLKSFLSWCTANASHKSLKVMLEGYAKEQPLQTKGLEAVFDNLSTKPSARKNEVVIALIHETKNLFNNASTTEVCDALIINYVQYIVQHKFAAYGIASKLAAEINSNYANEILIELQEMEKEADAALDYLAVEHIATPEVV